MEDKSMMGRMGESITSFFGRKKKEPPPPPKLGSCRRHPYGAFEFRVNAAAKLRFEVLASTNLTNWAPIAEHALEGNEFVYVDSEAHKFSYRFYRVREEYGGYSENVIGYATFSTPPGFSMIANPFRAESNRLCDILPEVPEGSTFNKFDHLKLKLTDNAFKNGNWVNPNESLVPGEGAIFLNPTGDFRVISFVGTVIQGKLFNPIPAGFSIRSSLVPKAGRLNADLQFPISDGDVVHLFDRDLQKYNIITYDPKKWAHDPPLIGIGESFWVGKAAAANWVQDFYIT